MKMVIAVTVIVLLSCSTAVADWAYGVPVVAPGTVVHSYYPGGSYPVSPVYGYSARVVTASPYVVYRRSVVVAPRAVVVAPRVVYRAPVVIAPRAVYRAPVVIAPRAVYMGPVVVRPKVYVRGRPIRNAIRAVLP